MSKRTLKGRNKIKHGLVGKTMGRSRGPLVMNEHVGYKVTQKLNDAINRNKKGKYDKLYKENYDSIFRKPNKIKCVINQSK